MDEQRKERGPELYCECGNKMSWDEQIAFGVCSECLVIELDEICANGETSWN